MKILVTGSSGLVGSNIVKAFEKTKHFILTPSIEELDLLSINSVKNYIYNNDIDFIVHCAGKVGGIQSNIKYPLEFLYENLEMGKNLLMTAREKGIKKLINFGTSCMYPRNAPNPLKEEYILKGELEPTNEGYALAKITIQRFCSYINKEYSGFSYKTVVPCNLYGEGDKFDPDVSHLIPAIIYKIHNAMINDTNEIVIWGSGKTRREFMYIEDVSSFLMYAMENFNAMPELLNVGLGYDFSIDEYYKVASEVMGYKGIFIHDTSKPEGMMQKLVDITLVQKFGWKAQIDLKTGIKKTYDYFLKKYSNGA